MNKDFWLDRWKQNKTGWHQSAVEPALVQAFSGGKVTQVFVPFCGKSLDLVWLAEQGYNVIGVELSVLACEMFFKENKIRYQKYSDGAFQTFKSENIEIWNGDFFDLNPVHLQKIGAVYDRAALIALPR